MIKAISVLATILMTVAPVKSNPVIYAPQCAPGGAITVTAGWKAPVTNPGEVDAVLYLFETRHSGEAVSYMDYIGQDGTTHLWQATLSNPYPAYWKAHVTMYAGGEILYVTNQNQPGGCGLFLPVVSR